MIAIDEWGALLFDLDGTLVDTMPLHYRAYAEVFRGEGLNLSEAVFMDVIGAPARAAIPKMLDAIGAPPREAEAIVRLHEAKKQVFESILAAAPPHALSAARLLERWHGRKPCALVSSGNRSGVTAILVRMGWSGWFEAIVTGDEIERGKPAPDPFLRAAALLRVAPARCLVFEDTDDGLAAADAAGMARVDVRAEAVAP
ncbi:MAG: HAD family hydrolase [Sphingomicrobium sp.]|nr:HAD-IA family hydrolase [Sphingomonadales bacterium]